MMHSFLQFYRDDITILCQQHGVVRLYAFGSITSDAFDERKSDVDLLVELPNELSPEKQGDTYFKFLFELETLLNRPVDLIMGQSFRNPYFARAVEQSKQLVYAMT